jgi:hypothetical protein
MAFFYTMGYPFYTIIFGFAYFAQVMNLIIALFLIFNLLRESKVDQRVLYLMLNLLLFGMFVCYSLFVVFVFPPLFIAIWYLYKNEDLILIAKREVAIFLLPCILGLYNSFVNIGDLQSGGLSNEGGCYMDLYSNFLRLLPLVIPGMVYFIKKNRFDFTVMLTVWSVLLLILMLYLHQKNHGVSLYYVSKVYSLLWFTCFVFMFVTIIQIAERIPLVLAGAVCTLLLSIVVHVSPVPARIAEDKPGDYVTLYEHESALYPNIYLFNELWADRLNVLKWNDYQPEE